MTIRVSFAASQVLASAVLVFLLSVSAVAPAGAQAGSPGGDGVPERWPLPRVTGPIEIDGRVDEPAWMAIEPLPATQHIPRFGNPPTERTEFRVAYDDDYLYVSCRAWDSDPDGIRAPSLERDDGSLGNDWCTVNIDSFNDKETTLMFGTTPAGIRTEVVFPDDGTRPGNFTWNTFWDAASSRDERGWQAEIRIPFSSLRFQREPGTDTVVMGMGVWRNIARKTERITWPPISPQWGFVSIAKASQLQEVTLEGIRSSRPLYVTPYLLGGASRTHGPDAPGTGYDATVTTTREVGLDLKHALSSNTTLDVTLNTDFAQVEADDRQVNLTRFSLFFPEKRLFFQERASVFEFSLGGVEQLFHSRRIGIVDGERVPIYGGVRLVGRFGSWDLGLLDMQTAATSLGPGENMGVLRLRRRILNENSYVGGILTSRIAEGGGESNLVGGVDAVLRLAGQDYLTVNVARSSDDLPMEGGRSGGVGAPGLARIAWERRGQDGLVYGLDLTRVGAAFEPGLGFLRRRDYTRGTAHFGYGWRPGDDSSVLTHGPAVEASVFTRNRDGVAETVRVTPRWSLAFKSGHSLTAAVDATYENLEAGFGLPDGATVPAGEHRFLTGRLAYSPPPGRLVRVAGSLEAGGFYDGRVVTLRLAPTWNASRHLGLGGTYQVDDVRLPDRDEGFTAHVARLRARIMVSARVSLSGFIQYASTADRLSANVRFRYNPSEGHDLYLVWDESLVIDRFRLDPVPPLSERRTLLLKYSRTVPFGL